MELAARTGCWAKSGTPLPYDYEVEYIASPNTAYIDLGVMLDSNDEVRFRVTIDEYSGSYFPLFGVWDGSGTFYIQAGSGNDTRTTFAFGEDVKKVSGVNYNTRPFSFTISVKDGVFVCAENGARLVYSASFVGQNNAWYGRANGQYTYGGLRNLYAIEVVGKFKGIPCVKDGVPCFYDEVSKTFKYNAGTGDFIAGPRVN